jgi:hypothetical protein
LLPYVYMLQIHMWCNWIIVACPFHGHSPNVRFERYILDDLIAPHVYLQHELSQKHKKFMIRLHCVLPYNTSLSIHFWKAFETKCQKKWVFKLGSKRTVHSQFGLSQFGQLRLKRSNKNEDAWKNVCSLFFSFVFVVGTWDVLKGNLVTVASIIFKAQ